MAENRSNSTSMRLSHEQVRVIQNELRKVYESKKEETNYSFPMMAQEIEDYWRIEMPGEIRAVLPVQFRDMHSPGLFVEGKKNDNFRKYVMGEAQSMSPIRLWAAFTWLVWPENEFSNLTIADLNPKIKATQSKIIKLLDEHLFQGCDYEPMINHTHFAPEYAEAVSDPSNWICFGQSISERVIQLRLFETHSDALLVFDGQLVISGDDTGYGFLKSMTTGEAKMVCFIPQGDEIFSGGKIERFSLVEVSSARSSFRAEIDLPITSFVRAVP